MRSKLFALLALLVLLPAVSRADWRENLALGGYVRETPLLWRMPDYGIPSGSGVVGGSGSGRQFTNLLHNRINLKYYASRSATVGVEVKTRLFSGDGANLMLAQTELLGGNQAYFNWDRRFIKQDRNILISTLDRAWVNYYAGPAQITLGRQRVAWGTSFTWNPIDIFNPSNPLDFDNEEKPGSDAARVQVYLGPNSKVEAAVAPTRETDNTIAAAELVLNQWEYDWVLMGGRRGPETVFGGAWAGNILGGGFRGELLGAIPREGYVFFNPYLYLPGPIFGTPPAQDQPYLMGTVDGDYTFDSGYYLHGAVLLNTAGTTGKGGGLNLFESFTRGWLSPAKMSLFAQASKDLSPLVHLDLTGILNPYDHSWYAGPTVTWSVVTNLDFTATGLIFGGDAGTEFGDNSEILMGRLKYSF